MGSNHNSTLLRSLCDWVIVLREGLFRIGSATLADPADRNARLGFAVSGDLNVPKKPNDRRAPRRACEINAWIRAEGCFATQQCRILDCSQTGVRLEIANAYRTPKRFVLLRSKDRPGIHATVKWRRNTLVGAEFVAPRGLQQNQLTRNIAYNVTKLRELLRR